MKQVEISKLMDEYRDSEFFPEGGSTVDPEAVKDLVLAKIKPAAGKRRLSGRKKLLLAAGLAAALLLIGAGFPYMQHRLVSGVLTFQQTADSRITSLVHYGPVMELEEGRLFFVQDDGQRIDITDRIDENTPYIFDGSDPEQDMVYYLIMGGTPDGYGYLEWIEAPDPFYHEDDTAVYNSVQSCYNFSYVIHDGQADRYATNDGGLGGGAIDWNTAKDHPWLIAGAKELGLPFVDSESETNAVFYAP